MRNAYVAGHAVSWSFAGAGDEQRVAILVPDATPTHVRVIACNLGAAPILARMTAWDVEPGAWTLVQAAGPDPDVLPGSGVAPRSLELERSGQIEVTFAPGVATVLELRLAQKGTPYWARPDLGIGERDVTVLGRRMSVTVHSLGAVDAPAARVVVRDALGVRIAQARVPAIKAPSGLRPSIATVSLALPARASLSGASVALETAGGVREITRANNRVLLPSPAGGATMIAGLAPR